MDPTDFLALYQELGLRPDCGIDDFKLAYRRRIAALHPDRQRGDGESARDPLQRLTRQYGAAMAFHRSHGRLPGARMAVRGAASAATVAVATAPAARMRKGRIMALVTAGVLGVVGWLSWPGEGDDATGDRREDAAPTTAKTERQATARAAFVELRLGMSMAEVLELEKEPIHRGDSRWDYGPSWIAFEQGRVSDWYSSPFRRLRHATTRPGATATADPAR